MSGRGQTARWPAVRTAGKVFLSGEYGVLVGAPALVLAVRRRARVVGDRPAPEAAREQEAARVLRAELADLDAERRLPPGLPAVDTSALHADAGEKLGLGSSAAWAAAVAGSALRALDLDLEDPSVRERAWRLGRRLHGEGGSGGDVAASVLGGAVHYRLPPDAPAQARRVDLAPERRPFVVRGPAPVSTARAVAAMREARHTSLMADAAAAAAALTGALLDPGASPALPVREAAGVLARIAAAVGLGGAGTEVVARADAVARDFGGAAKPSGAGAGDLVLVFAPGVAPAERPRVLAALRAAGLEPLDLEMDEAGLHAVDGGPALAAAGVGR